MQKHGAAVAGFALDQTTHQAWLRASQACHINYEAGPIRLGVRGVCAAADGTGKVNLDTMGELNEFLNQPGGFAAEFYFFLTHYSPRLSFLSQPSPICLMDLQVFPI